MADIEKELLSEDIARLESEANLDAMPSEPSAAEVAQANRDQEELEQAFNMLLGSTFDIFCPAWNIQPEETKQLSAAYAAIIEKYFPGGVSRFGVEINAVLITAVIFAPRAKMPRKVKPKDDNNASE